jgi:hypothetical protein
MYCHYVQIFHSKTVLPPVGLVVPVVSAARAHDGGRRLAPLEIRDGVRDALDVRRAVDRLRRERAVRQLLVLSGLLLFLAHVLFPLLQALVVVQEETRILFELQRGVRAPREVRELWLEGVLRLLLALQPGLHDLPAGLSPHGVALAHLVLRSGLHVHSLLGDLRLERREVVLRRLDLLLVVGASQDVPLYAIQEVAFEVPLTHHQRLLA